MKNLVKIISAFSILLLLSSCGALHPAKPTSNYASEAVLVYDNDGQAHYLPASGISERNYYSTISKFGVEYTNRSGLMDNPFPQSVDDFMANNIPVSK